MTAGVAMPFERDMTFTYGEAEPVSARVRRVMACNPGPFTLHGTGAHIIGRGQVAVIDPGPDHPAQLAALLHATRGERITHIFVTHAHMDHSPLAKPLAEATGAIILAGAGQPRPSCGGARLEAGDDLGFRPDVALRDGERFHGPDWTIEAVATPGHTSTHFAYALIEENTLFPGDCVMGWSTSVVSPPDGDMGDYMASLEKVRARSFDVLLPTHGPPVRDPRPLLDAYIAHRRTRERQILASLEACGAAKARDLVRDIYADVEARLHPAALHSVLAHLLDLYRRGLIDLTGPPNATGLWRSRALGVAA